ncbi:Major Facilitator [Gracilaria domingensis]|nr:Major Facilitator [Gracilaria domingensis]
MSSAEEGRLPTRPTHPLAARAIAIPTDDDDDGSEIWAQSPGAESYVANSESWRPMPPPMLASSLDTSTRFRPSLSARPDLFEQSPSVSTVGSRTSSSQQLPQLSQLPLEPPAVYGAVQPAPSVIKLPPVAPSPSPRRAHRPGRRRHVGGGRASVSGAFESIKVKLVKLMVHVRQLEEAPRELWLIFALKFLSSYAYFSLSLVLTIFLTDEFGMSDTAAGWAYGAYGVMSTFFGLLCGWFIDYLGVRASLLVGALIGALSRFIMAVTLSRHMAVLMLYSLLPFAECLGIPIMTIGIKRYTNAHNRTFAFSLFYSMMNVAALCAGPLVDLARSLFDAGVTIDLHSYGQIKMSGLRLVILSSAISTAMMWNGSGIHAEPREPAFSNARGVEGPRVLETEPVHAAVNWSASGVSSFGRDDAQVSDASVRTRRAVRHDLRNQPVPDHLLGADGWAYDATYRVISHDYRRKLHLCGEPFLGCDKAELLWGGDVHGDAEHRRGNLFTARVRVHDGGERARLRGHLLEPVLGAAVLGEAAGRASWHGAVGDHRGDEHDITGADVPAPRVHLAVGGVRERAGGGHCGRKRGRGAQGARPGGHADGVGGRRRRDARQR